MSLGREFGLSPSDIVLDGDPASSPQKGSRTPPNIRPMSVVARWLEGSRWHDMEVGLGPGHIVLDGDPASLPQKGGIAPNFRSVYVVAKWLDGSRCHLVRR